MNNINSAYYYAVIERIISYRCSAREDVSMRSFSISLQGRLKNFNLPKNQALIPLFEAIVNSIHAIEERQKSGFNFDGRITIRILREGQTVMPGVGELPHIDSFEIIDNGVGFDEPNFGSFMESDSTYKSDIGGKGVGRFSWLLAFKEAHIESIYSDNGEYVKREFVFSPNDKNLDDTLVDCETANENKTTVSLLHYLSPYRENVPKRAATIAMHIVQHCLIYFMSTNCPQITLEDQNETYNLNILFQERIHPESNNTCFKIG